MNDREIERKFNLWGDFTSQTNARVNRLESRIKKLEAIFIAIATAVEKEEEKNAR